MDAAGGGGYGNPLERDLELIENDVVDGYVSGETAKKEYGAVINPDTMKVDADASEKLRASLLPKK
jgi:N-methylhydantoinase B